MTAAMVFQGEDMCAESLNFASEVPSHKAPCWTIEVHSEQENNLSAGARGRFDCSMSGPRRKERQAVSKQTRIDGRNPGHPSAGEKEKGAQAGRESWRTLRLELGLR